MISKNKLFILLTLVAISGCSSSQKRDVAQTTRKYCTQPRSLEEIQKLTFKGNHAELRGNEPPRSNVIRKEGVNVEVTIGSKEVTDVTAGLTIQRPEDRTTTSFYSKSRRYRVTCYKNINCQEYNQMTGKTRSCKTDNEIVAEVETPCTITILSNIFTVEPNCQELQVVPSSAPVESAPTNSPVET